MLFNLLFNFSGKSCVNRERKTETENVDTITVCTENFCKDHSCVPHCCPEGMYQTVIDEMVYCEKDSRLNNSLWTEGTKLKIKHPKKGMLPVPTFLENGLICPDGKIIKKSN